MKTIPRVIGGLIAVVALVVVVFVYGVHAVRSSDHQDTYNLANRANTSADITDVYIFPSPSNPNNVVLAMDVSPLIPAGMGTAKFFDPTLMWQFKISHQTSGVEDQVIQFGVSGTDGNQVISVYGPAKPNEVGTTNTFVTSSGTVGYNGSTTFSNGVQAFAGPRADPFFFDLFAFFSFLGDRNAAAHTSQTDPGTGNSFANSNNVGAGASFATTGSKTANPLHPSFAGFPAGTVSNAQPGGYACRTDVPVQNALADLGGGFNVLSFVVEVPKALLTTGFSSPVIHVWATANSSTGS
jgi:Domain of unknown function (DUF4331)